MVAKRPGIKVMFSRVEIGCRLAGEWSEMQKSPLETLPLDLRYSVVCFLRLLAACCLIALFSFLCFSWC